MRPVRGRRVGRLAIRRRTEISPEREAFTGVETYPYAPAWAVIGGSRPTRVVLDFNRTILVWFAFTDHATCPAPSEGNALTVPVRAGERQA